MFFLLLLLFTSTICVFFSLDFPLFISYQHHFFKHELFLNDKYTCRRSNTREHFRNPKPREKKSPKPFIEWTAKNNNHTYVSGRCCVHCVRNGSMVYFLLALVQRFPQLYFFPSLCVHNFPITYDQQTQTERIIMYESSWKCINTFTLHVFFRMENFYAKINFIDFNVQYAWYRN